MSDEGSTDIPWRTASTQESGPQDTRPPGSRPGAKPAYSTLTEAQRWVWHTNVYAFRRVYLGLHEETSPCDPKGDWYDQFMVREEAARLARIKERRDGIHHRFTFTDEELDDRREWALIRRFPNWTMFLEAVQRGEESVKPFISWSAERHAQRMPARVSTFKRLGASATPAPEYGQHR